MKRIKDAAIKQEVSAERPSPGPTMQEQLLDEIRDALRERF